MTHKRRKCEPTNKDNGNGSPPNVPPKPPVPPILSPDPPVIDYEYDEEYETIDQDNGWEMLD